MDEVIASPLNTLRIPFYHQNEKWTCGAASMRMVLESVGIKRTEQQLAKMLQANKVRGTWHDYFPHVAERYKLNYIVKRNAKIADLRSAYNRKYRIIVCYFIKKNDFDHYAVVMHIDKDCIYLLDPGYYMDHKPGEPGPVQSYSLKYFRKMWYSHKKYDNEKAWFIGIKDR